MDLNVVTKVLGDSYCLHPQETSGLNLEAVCSSEKVVSTYSVTRHSGVVIEKPSLSSRICVS